MYPAYKKFLVRIFLKLAVRVGGAMVSIAVVSEPAYFAIVIIATATKIIAEAYIEKIY